MTVGGWFDAEDLYGPLNIYQAIEKNNPNTFNCLVMGPWSHGDWAKEEVSQVVGNIGFGENATHTFGDNLDGVVDHEITFPLRENHFIVSDESYDELLFLRPNFFSRIRNKLKKF